MSTNRTFNSMLNEYLTYDLLWEQLQRRNYLLEKVEKDNNWKGGPLPVPFRGQRASSTRYGKLTAQGDISEFGYVRGYINDYKEIWGTMKWNHRDLIEHGGGLGDTKPDGRVDEQSFLKDLPQQIEDFIDLLKDQVSVNLLQGDHFASLTADATANDGNITVDRPERFDIDQKVIVDDDDSTPLTGFVKSIDINTRVINLVTTRGGATVLDFSAVGADMTVAQNAKVYTDGADTTANTFTSLRDQLLSAANGGSSTLFGVSKLAYPHLQAINIDGSGINATNILDEIFDAWVTINKLGKGHATHAVMGYKNLGAIMKLLESGAGAYRHVETKASVYGYTEIVVIGVKGQLTITGIHEMEEDIIYYLDWRSMKLHSNGYFRKHIDPDGKQYYTVREEDGYFYICDISFFGEFAVNKACANGVSYGVNF